MTKIALRKKSLVGVLVTLIIAVSLGLFWRFGFTPGEITQPSTDIEVTPQQSAFKEASKPVYLLPREVKFAGKEIKLVEVGVEEDGTLGVPSDWQTAGWYGGGAKAGEEGNIIIDGHYDTNTGAPGAFWELKNLQVDDKVLLTDSLGRVFEYSVISKSFISVADPKRAEVFDSGEDKVLTLITCGGVWDYSSGTYNKRLVIVAKFDKMEKSW